MNGSIFPFYNIGLVFFEVPGIVAVVSGLGFSLGCGWGVDGFLRWVFFFVFGGWFSYGFSCGFTKGFSLASGEVGVAFGIGVVFWIGLVIL